MGRPLPDLEHQLEGGTGLAADTRRAWATALALEWLRLHAANSEPEWRLLAAKAEQYLAGISATAPGGVAWSEMAASFLARN